MEPDGEALRTIAGVEAGPGHFYLGGLVDDSGKRTEALTYEAADLTTHGVIVGMTGSGKTGLGIDLLEESLLSGVPGLIIDPKGDMTNLLLNFPDLAPSDFRPWIDQTEARRENVTPDEMAARVATEWKDGLAAWDIGQERMRRLRDTTDLTVYTPGSTAGAPLNVLGSLAAPIVRDLEALRDEIEGFVSSLLVLAGIKSDPISGPEHILLATIIETAWSEGHDLDLASLIIQAKDPSFRKLGVFEVDAFIPPRDRTALAMKLNGLVASPSFSAWREGEPLDIGQLLGETAERPDRTRGAIFYLAHLSEPERQFFVTLLLSKVVTHMRAGTGSSDLKALVYMDEVAGFCPPSAEPPSKKPILTLAKQARAFGYGMVLTTQNPMDLDYKVMSNAGTWMIGRLQTERDKARILEGMQTAGGGVDIKALDMSISGLDKRQFVLHTSRGRPPVRFVTRWAMSYLAGPLTKDQLSELPGAPVRSEPVGTTATSLEPADGGGDGAIATDPPLIPVRPDPVVAVWKAPSGTPTLFLDPAAPWAGRMGVVAGSLMLKPVVAATVNLLYDEARAKVEHREVFEVIITEPGQTLTELTVIALDHDPRDFVEAPPDGAQFTTPADPMRKARFWTNLKTELTDYLVASRRVTVWKNPGLKLYSRVGERESDFRARCIAAASEGSDRAIAALRDKYRVRIEGVRDQLAVYDRRVADLDADIAASRQGEVFSGVGDVLGAVLGGRSRNTISRAATRRSQTRQIEARRQKAEGSKAARLADLADLEDDLARDVVEITSEWDDRAALIEEIEIPLERVDVEVVEMKMVWVPS